MKVQKNQNKQKKSFSAWHCVYETQKYIPCTWNLPAVMGGHKICKWQGVVSLHCLGECLFGQI